MRRKCALLLGLAASLSAADIKTPPWEKPIEAVGRDLFRENCAVCHGLPGEPETAIAKGMFPKPPQLFRGIGVTDDEPWETYWKVDGGIRMTGMPGFHDQLGENRMWQVTVLLKHADKISPAVKAELASPVGALPAAAPAAAAPPSAGAPAKN